MIHLDLKLSPKQVLMVKRTWAELQGLHESWPSPLYCSLTTDAEAPISSSMANRLPFTTTLTMSGFEVLLLTWNVGLYCWKTSSPPEVSLLLTAFTCSIVQCSCFLPAHFAKCPFSYKNGSHSPWSYSGRVDACPHTCSNYTPYLPIAMCMHVQS